MYIPHAETISVSSLPHTYISQAVELQVQINTCDVFSAVLTDRAQLLNTARFCHSERRLLQLEKNQTKQTKKEKKNPPGCQYFLLTIL